MNNMVLQAKKELGGLTKATGLKTREVRKISSRLFKSLDNKDINNVFFICEELLKEDDWALGVIAYDWAYRVRKQYNNETYDIFYRWLEQYVRGWGDCDDFCTHAFGDLIRQDKKLFNKILNWTSHQEFWVRRAAAVVLIPAISHEDYEGIAPFMISDLLMKDEHDLVRKGYGWMLKVLSLKEEAKVYSYLEKNKDIMPRVAFRYALEKMDKERKKELMK